MLSKLCLSTVEDRHAETAISGAPLNKDPLMRRARQQVCAALVGTWHAALKGTQLLSLDEGDHIAHRGVQEVQRLQVPPAGVAVVQAIEDRQPVHVACGRIGLPDAGRTIPAQTASATVQLVSSVSVCCVWASGRQAAAALSPADGEERCGPAAQGDADSRLEPQQRREQQRCSGADHDPRIRHPAACWTPALIERRSHRALSAEDLMPWKEGGASLR